jgi:hypothetical protein
VLAEEIPLAKVYHLAEIKIWHDVAPAVRSCSVATVCEAIAGEITEELPAWLPLGLLRQLAAFGCNRCR